MLNQFLALLLATTLLATSAGSTLFASDLFFDDFSDLDPQDGQPARWGLWHEDDRGNRTLTATPDGMVFSYEGPPFTYLFLEEILGENDSVLGDISVRTQVRLTEGATISIITRQTGWGDDVANPFVGYYGYYAGIFGGSVTSIGLSADNVDFKTGTTNLDPSVEDVVIQVDNIGNVLHLWAWRPDESKPRRPLLSYTDNHNAGIGFATSGQLVFGISRGGFGGTIGDDTPFGAEAIFRYIQVSTTAIPEPSALSLTTVACTILLALRQRRTKSRA